MNDTIYRLFVEVAARREDGIALMHRVRGKYEGTSYRQLARLVNEVAAGLRRRGVRAGDRVGIYSYNRPEWVVADLATMKLGAVSVPVYHTLPPESVGYILRDADVTHLVVETPELFANIAAILAEVPRLSDVITLFDRDRESRVGKELFSFETLRAAGARALAEDPALGAAHDAAPDDLVTVVYTSGTTGEPKGTMLSHANILSNVNAAIRMFGINEDDTMVSFLPLCHMFERTCGYYTMLLAGATIAYAESLQTIRDDVAAVRPTMLIVVPRVLEKVYNAVADKVATGSALSRRLMLATLRTYSRWARHRRRGRVPPLWLRLKHWLLGLLVVRKLKKLGGGRIRLLVSGAAPLERRLARVIRNLGFELIEGYGLTETSPVVCAAVPGEARVGTVGRPFPGVDVKIGPDNEIMVRGPNVMQGYLNRPEETAKVIDPDGWFHTGDQGRFDDWGNLVITGRIKEIIVNSYGKNVAPVPIEHAILGSEYAEQAMVVGDKRPYLSALIVPGRIALKSLARERGVEDKRLEDLLVEPRIVEHFRREIDAALQNFAGYEQVRQFRLIAEPFTVENGLLTPTLKIRRSSVAAAYEDLIESMYRE